MPREPARNKKPRKEPTNFVARFRFSGQISNRATFFLPKCGFSGYSIPPNQLFQHFPTPTGVRDVARFQKTAENRNRATFTRHRNVPKRPEACVHSKKTRPRPSNVCFVIKRNIRNIRIPWDIGGLTIFAIRFHERHSNGRTESIAPWVCLRNYQYSFISNHVGVFSTN